MSTPPDRRPLGYGPGHTGLDGLTEFLGADDPDGPVIILGQPITGRRCRTCGYHVVLCCGGCVPFMATDDCTPCACPTGGGRDPQYD